MLTIAYRHINIVWGHSFCPPQADGIWSNRHQQSSRIVKKTLEHVLCRQSFPRRVLALTMPAQVDLERQVRKPRLRRGSRRIRCVHVSCVGVHNARNLHGWLLQFEA